MLFLVEMIQERAMPGAPNEYEELKSRVCRTLEELARTDGAHGGVVAGGRAVVFVIEEEDAEALDARLQRLPLWDCVETTRVTPLVSFRARLGHNRSQEPSPSRRQETET